MSLEETKWSAEDFIMAKTVGLTLWTKEQMEPTISALVLAPAVLPDICEWSDMSELSREEIMRK